MRGFSSETAVAPGHPPRPAACRGRLVLLGSLLAATAAGPAPAHDLTPSMGRPATARKHFQKNPFDRAGNPQCISPFAAPAESPHETGYHVGGGARMHARSGQERHPHEGVWGTDYAGALVPKHTQLRWWHGTRSTGGPAAYRTDGPRLLHAPR